MLYIVLILVLAALGLLVTALLMANSLWAWVSIGLSVLAGVLLIADWLRRRRSRAKVAEQPTEQGEETAEAGETEAKPETEPEAEPEPEGQTAVLPASGELAEKPSHTEKAAGDTKAADRGLGGDPDEEQADVADTLIVSELTAEVLVVDEHPRYHLDDCEWLGDRETIPLPAAEARELGFSPCGRCAPDRTLAARHRAGRAPAGE